MTHLRTCRTYTELTGNIVVHFSDPDQNCNDASHTNAFTEEVK